MARQFEIVENLDTSSREAYPYLIVLQHDRAETVATIVVAPLAPSSIRLSASRMHPRIEVRGERYVVFTEQLAAIPRGALGRVVGSAEADHYQLIAALDMLFTGI